MKEIVKKMITEAMAAQHADVNQIKKKRGQKFVIDDTKTYVDAVKKHEGGRRPEQSRLCPAQGLGERPLHDPQGSHENHPAEDDPF